MPVAVPTKPTAIQKAPAAPAVVPQHKQSIVKPTPTTHAKPAATTVSTTKPAVASTNHHVNNNNNNHHEPAHRNGSTSSAQINELQNDNLRLTTEVITIEIMNH